jgi:hypothetical protein
MLPFMTAASICDENTVRASNKREEEEMFCIKMNMSYALLREDPSAVSSGIKESAYEAPLKKRLRGMEDALEAWLEENKRLREELKSKYVAKGGDT